MRPPRVSRHPLDRLDVDNDLEHYGSFHFARAEFRSSTRLRRSSQPVMSGNSGSQIGIVPDRVGGFPWRADIAFCFYTKAVNTIIPGLRCSRVAGITSTAIVASVRLNL